MSVSWPSDTDPHPPSRKPRRLPPEMATRHNHSNPINDSKYSIETIQSAMILPLLESDSWQGEGLTTSHGRLGAGCVGGWQVPNTSPHGIRSASTALNASDFDRGYWGSDAFNNSKPMEYWMANDNPTASINFYGGFRNSFPYPVNSFDVLQSPSQNFDSINSSPLAELGENNSFGFPDDCSASSHHGCVLSDPTSPFTPEFNEYMKFWNPSSYPDGLADFDNPQQYQAPQILNSGHISLDKLSNQAYSRKSDEISRNEDSVAYQRYTQRTPMVLTRSFDPFHGAKDNILKPSPKLEWETVIAPSRSTEKKSSGRIRLSGPPISKPYKTGRRQGPLQPETARKASAMRRRRACWSCWLLKVPCSIEDECHRCQITRPGLFRGIVCSRSPLADYANFFFPDVLVSHLREAKIQKLIEENVLEFTDNTVKVEVSSSDVYPTMDLSLRIFIPSNQNFLFLYRLEEQYNSQIAMVQKYSVPVGLPLADVILLKRKCLNHIKAIIAEDQCLEERSFDEISDIRWRVLRAIECYRKSPCNTNVLILKKAVMLREMHAFMGRSLSIVNGEDLSDSLESLSRTANQKYDMEVPSTLLNREIKQAMHLLLRETTEQVLTLLEKELKEKAKAAWAPCLCTILILIMCSEDLRIALDGFAVHTQSQGPKNEPLSRAHAFQIARQLDDRLLADCKALFHAIYKSSKRGGSRSERVFNPIRDGLNVDDNDELPQEVHVLVEDMSDLLETHGHEMAEYMREPSLEDGDDVMESHMDFRQRNSGRLVSAFLRSFLETSS